MFSLTFGLLGLSGAYLCRALMFLRLMQIFWALNAGAALVVFILNPQPFSHMALWAGAGACLWISSPARDKVEWLYAGVSGFLIGASLPYLDLFVSEFTAAPDGTSVAFLMLCALVAGVVLARCEGGAMASVSSALAMGMIGSSSFGLSILFVALVAAFLAPKQTSLSHLLLMLLPALGFFGDLA